MGGTDDSQRRTAATSGRAGGAATWPLAARAQEPQLPVLINGGLADASTGFAAVFRKGLECKATSC
jgi:hypothetical protein